MITEDKKLKLIELRANGYSFQKIAKELFISKPTAIEIAKENDQEIQNMRGLVREKRLEALEVDYNSKLENLSEVYRKVRDEIKKRDLSDIKTDTLIKMLFSIQENISKELLTPLYLEKVKSYRFNDNSWEV